MRVPSLLKSFRPAPLPSGKGPPRRRVRLCVESLEERAVPALLLAIPTPNPESGDAFGVSVAALGTNILVGAPKDDAGAVDQAGTVYLLDGSTGALLRTIPNPNPEFGDSFGGSVA